MKKIIIYSTRGLTGINSKNIVHQMSILKYENAQIDLLTNTKTDKIPNFIKDNSFIEISEKFDWYSDFYYKEVVEMNDWEEVYEQIDVSHFKNYDAICLFGGMFSSGSALKRGSKRNYVLPKDNHGLKFQSVANYVTHCLAILKAHRTYNIPLHEIVFDPLEMSLDLVHEDYKPLSNYYLYHGYDIPRYNMLRLDSSQAFINGQNPSVPMNDIFGETEVVKKYDFTFGLTVVEKQRIKYYDYVKEFCSKFNESNLYVINKFTKENTFLDRDMYLRKISLSRFTMILPSYDNTCFSAYRLIESIGHDCLPFIHKDCNIDEISESFDVDLSVLVTETIFSETKRLELLDVLKNKIMKVERKLMI